MRGEEVPIVQQVHTPLSLGGPSMDLRKRSIRKARGPRG